MEEPSAAIRDFLQPFLDLSSSFLVFSRFFLDPPELIRDSVSSFLDFPALFLDFSGESRDFSGEVLDFLAWFIDLCGSIRDQIPGAGRRLRAFSG
jgi:hypothetical protein